MGNLISSSSSGSSKKFSAEFGKEASELDRIVTDIMTDRGSYASSKEQCSKEFNLLLASDLKRHLKLDLADLKDAVYFVPNRAAVHARGKMQTKDQLCDMISQHYGKLLSAVQVLKLVHKTETSGKGSFFDEVTSQNFVTSASGELTEVRFCRRLRPSLGVGGREGLSAHLPGLRQFTDDFLDAAERGVFHERLAALLSLEQEQDKTALACGDVLFTNGEYAQVFESSAGASSPPAKLSQDVERCRLYRERVHVNSLTSPAAGEARSKRSPFLSSAVCDRTKNVVLSELDAKTRSEVVALYAGMKRKAVGNLRKTRQLLMQLVEPAGGSFKGKSGSGGGAFKLRHLQQTKLDPVLLSVKKCVATYYLSTLDDFNKIVSFLEKS